MNIAKGIISIAKTGGLSAKDVSRLAKMEDNYLSIAKSKNNIPTYKTIQSFAKVLNVSVGAIVIASLEESDFPPGDKYEMFEIIKPLIIKLSKH